MKNALLLLVLLSLNACYSFKGISIDPNDKTFYVKNFETQAVNAPPTLGLDFTEKLKEKIRQETSLKYNDEKPDIEISGKITDFRVDIVAPKPGEVVTQNKLVVGYRVNLVNNRDEARSWKGERSFQHFAEFPNSADLLSVQDALLTDINKQILEEIFNAAFNNW